MGLVLFPWCAELVDGGLFGGVRGRLGAVIVWLRVGVGLAVIGCVGFGVFWVFAWGSCVI